MRGFKSRRVTWREKYVSRYLDRDAQQTHQTERGEEHAKEGARPRDDDDDADQLAREEVAAAAVEEAVGGGVARVRLQHVLLLDVAPARLEFVQ